MLPVLLLSSLVLGNPFVPNWESCLSNAECQQGFTCCVGSLDLETEKKTCRMIEGTDCKAFKARRFESCEIEGIEITCEQETDVCCTARGEVGGKKTCREQYTCNPDQGLPLPPPGPPPGTTTSTSSSTTTVTAETTTTTSDSSTTASTAAADSETTKSTSQPTPISGPNSPPTDPTDPLNPQLPPSMIGFYLPPGFEF